jgi:predicted ABC-type ATPase
LVVLRGNSGSGKSSTAQELRARLGQGIAWVEQDHLRRIVLREGDMPGGVNIGLIDQSKRCAQNLKKTRPISSKADGSGLAVIEHSFP